MVCETNQFYIQEICNPLKIVIINYISNNPSMTFCGENSLAKCIFIVKCILI